MTQRPHLTVVRTDEAPPPLLPPGVDLDHLPRAMIDIDWLCNSRFRRKATDSEMIAAVTLRAASYHQVPAGSLPDDDDELAFLAKVRADPRWGDVKNAALDGWTLCSDGRWYNVDLAKLVLHSWIVRLADRRRSAAGVARRRKKVFDATETDREIAAAVAALGCIDPHAPILQNYRTDQADINVAAADPTPGPTSGPTKRSEAKIHHLHFVEMIRPIAKPRGSRNSGSRGVRQNERRRAPPSASGRRPGRRTGSRSSRRGSRSARPGGGPRRSWSASAKPGRSRSRRS